MAEEIKIVASAVGFDQVDKALNNTAKGFNEVTASAKKTGDTLSKEMKNGSNQATQSLSNLSRVAQDAPYGIIGIANNINPLVESFQRLKAETGSTGSAFKALISGLTGPAGIGLAVGVITSLLVTFSQNVGKAKNELDPLVKANEEFRKSLEDAKSGALATGLQLQSFVDIAKNGQLPLEQRNEALKQANDILGKHGQQLTLTNVGTALATEQVRLYTQAIIAQAVATKYADKLADLSIQKTNKLIELDKARIGVKDAVKRVTDESNAGFTTEEAVSGQATVSLGIYNNSMKKVAQIKTELNQLNTDYNQTQTNLNNTVLQSTSAFGALGYKTKEVKEETKKAKKELETFDQTVIKTLGDLQDQEQISIAINTSTINEQIKIVKDEIARGIKEFNLPANDQRIIVLGVKLNELEAQAELEKVTKTIDKSVKEKKGKLTVKVPAQVTFDQSLVDIGATLQQGLANIASDLGVQFGETLGNAITGAVTFGDAFQNIFKSLGENIKSLGKQIIQTATLALLIKKNLFVNPALALAAGIGLTVLGTVISNSFKKQAFAVGTRNAPGGFAMVGERGPELVNLPRGSQVIPAAQTSNMMGAMQSIEVFGMLKGKDIFFSNKNYSKTYSTTT